MRLALGAAVAAAVLFSTSESFLTSHAGNRLLRQPSCSSATATSRVARHARSHLSMAQRRPYVAGNWKMNPGDLASAIKLAEDVVAATKGLSNVDIGLTPPHPFVLPVARALKGSNVVVGAQNTYVEEKGAFTGAVSTTMLKSVGCQYALCGHSERRVIFREDNALINRKVLKVLNSGITAILCVGESKEEYEAGLNSEVCAVQLGKNLAGVTAEQLDKLVIAYEPVWAIGTGLSATPEIAQSVHKYIRSWLADKYGTDMAETIRIQYGGSVTPETVDDLMAQPDIDGALVGGASLDAEKFARICKFSGSS